DICSILKIFFREPIRLFASASGEALWPQIVSTFRIDFVLRAVSGRLLPGVGRLQIEVFADQGGPSALCMLRVNQIREHLREIILEMTVKKIPQACAHARGHPVSMHVTPG